MKFYFGRFTAEHEEAGVDVANLFYNEQANTYYFYLVEFDESGEIRIQDSIGRMVPLDADDVDGLLVAARLMSTFYKGLKKNDEISELNHEKLLKEMANIVHSLGGSSDVC